MAVIVNWQAGSKNGVDAIDIVDVAIAIIVHAVEAFVAAEGVSASFAGVDPQVRGQIFVRGAHAGVDDCNDDP